MRSWIGAYLLAMLAISTSATSVWAVAIPIVDPGFDLYNPNTTTLVPNNRVPNQSAPGAGSGPVEDVPLLDFNTFAPAGTGDIPAGWTASGQKPAGTANTGRGRVDTGFDGHTSGSIVSINSFGADAYETSPGVFVSTPGRFTQVLTGVTVQPNTLYTATIEVMDIDVTGLGPFVPPDDNVVPGNRGRADDPSTTNIDETINRIILGLFAVNTVPASIVDLGGTLEFTDITPGGFFTDSDADPTTHETATSGGRSLLTLTVLTGATVPAGDLTISFTAGGAAENLHGFAPSAQTYFDNVTLDATPFGPPVEDADFDGDNDVDGQDFLIWQRGNGLGSQTSNVNGDADGSGTVNGTDLGIWRTEFGTPQASAAVGAVPEPASAVLCVFALLGGLAVRSPSRRLDSLVA